MAETKKSQTTEAKTTAAAATPALARASESSDPAVHQLLAHIDIAVRNGDDKTAQALRDELAALGFE
jgi:DNA-binding ferritin-like protein